jgi:hypothetical protein
MSYKNLRVHMPLKPQVTKLHQYLGETLRFSELVAENGLSYTLFLHLEERH